MTDPEASSPPPPPPSPPKPTQSDVDVAAASNDADEDQAEVERPPLLSEGSRKKSRLQWDEENLMLNAAEMERAGPRMKIDEPKTPFNNGSENGSSTSGSAHQSPPESPSFIPRDRLVGFGALEQGIGSSTGNLSDAASTGSAGSAGRSVQISDDNLAISAGSSPRSRELFAARRKAHYRNEARVNEWFRLNELEEDDTTNNARNNGNDHDDGGIINDVDDGDGDDNDNDNDNDNDVDDVDGNDWSEGANDDTHYVSLNVEQDDRLIGGNQDTLHNGCDHAADDKLHNLNHSNLPTRADQQTNGLSETTDDDDHDDL